MELTVLRCGVGMISQQSNPLQDGWWKFMAGLGQMDGLGLPPSSPSMGVAPVPPDCNRYPSSCVF